MRRSEVDRRAYRTVPVQFVSDFELPDGREVKHEISCPCHHCDEVWNAPRLEVTTKAPRTTQATGE
jgi:hypothetical protein